MIVNDNQTNRRILTLQIQSWGMEPLVFADPLEALAAVQCGEMVDLAILDMHMLQNLVNQKLAIRILERMRYRVEVAANGLEVLQALERQPMTSF